MPAQDTSKTKEKILFTLKKRGPSLPVHIAKETELDILFASAFLSELLSEKKLQISNMKVGSSPIYFIPEQKSMLENFSHYLKSKEKDAFIVLKEKKILKDLEQEPAIRVALRSIKDFAIPFKKGEEIFWRYFNFNEETKNDLQNKEKEIVEEVVENISNENEKTELPEPITPLQKPLLNSDTEKKEIQEEKSKIDIFDKPVEEKKKEEKIEFKKIILDYLQENKIKLIEETDVKKREFLGIGRIESDLGEMEILIMGKDKKKINEKDLKKIIEKYVENKMMILLLSTGEIDKKAKEFFREHKNIIKFFKI